MVQQLRSTRLKNDGACGTEQCKGKEPPSRRPPPVMHHRRLPRRDRSARLPLHAAAAAAARPRAQHILLAAPRSSDPVSQKFHNGTSSSRLISCCLPNEYSADPGGTAGTGGGGTATGDPRARGLGSALATGRSRALISPPAPCRPRERGPGWGASGKGVTSCCEAEVISTLQ